VDLETAPAPSLAPVERLLVQAAREIRVLAALTPLDAHRERARLAAALRTGQSMTPAWSYRSTDHSGVQRALAAAAKELELGRCGPPSPLYLGRARELLLEAALSGAAGSPRLVALACERFAAAGRVHAASASRLCEAWLCGPAPPEHGAPAEPSDSPHPRSLLSRMRAAVHEARLPFRVVATPSLAPLAATGDATIYVATGRSVTEEDAIRTVMHEVDGHARPRARAPFTRSILFRAGTARGADDQEGRALLLEERAGLLGPRRRRQLAARHRAVEAMQDGASFADVAFTLVRAHGLEAMEAIVAAERAFRGGNGRSGGLGRERVYLEALLRVKAHLAAHPTDEPVLASGQVAVDAAPALRPFVVAS
jgi:hypothetical protein